jgi:hypothetical protein
VPEVIQVKLDQVDLKDQRDKLETQVFQVDPVRLEAQESKVKMDPLDQWVHLEMMVIEDQMVPLDPQELLVLLVAKANVEREVISAELGKKELRVYLENPVKQEQKETVGQQVFKGNKEELENKELLEIQVKMVAQVNLGLKDNVERSDQLAFQVQKVPGESLVLMETLDHQDLLVNLETKGPKDHKDLPAQPDE